MTPNQRAQLIQATARAIGWSQAGEAQQQVWIDRAIGIVRELERAENVGNAIQLKHAIETVVRRKSA